MRLIIYKAKVGAKESDENFAPGQILSLKDSNRLVVAAGDRTSVEVLELQPAGKRRMPVAEFLRGHHPKAGDLLGLDFS
jgi:methionyl-tRNA formyltransferase